MVGDAEVTSHHVAELRIAFGRPHGGEMAERPEPETDQPEAQAEAERRRQRAVKNGDRARRAAEQDVLGERPMDRDGVAWPVAGVVDLAGHQTSAPPPTAKQDMKKLDAAKAIDRPKTLWISFRAPPDVSPKPRVSPVMMMTISARTLANRQ